MVSVYKRPSFYPVLKAIAYPSNMIYEGVIIVATKSKDPLLSPLLVLLMHVFTVYANSVFAVYVSFTC